MRRLILAGVCALALSSAPCEAQIATPGTVVFDPTVVTKLLAEIGIENAQLDQMVLTVQEVLQVYNEAVGIYSSVAQIVGADQWAPGLTGASSRNPLPFIASTHPGWVGGYNDPSSLPFGSQYMQQNTIGGDIRVFEDGAFVGTEIAKAIRSISSMQAVASNNIQAIENRIFALNDLFTHLANLGTIMQAGSLSARLQSEANYAQSQKIQSQNLEAAATQQLAVLQYNQRQWQYQDESNGIAVSCKALAASSNPLSLPECNRASAAGRVSAGGVPAAASYVAVAGQPATSTDVPEASSSECGPGTSPGLVSGAAGCVPN
jgi:hypothetical protein